MAPAPLQLPLAPAGAGPDGEAPERTWSRLPRLPSELLGPAARRRAWLGRPTVWLSAATIGCYVWVLICFWMYRKFQWFATLACILLVSATSRLFAVWMTNGYGLMQQSFDSFFFGMPLALFCFYGFFITHQKQACQWFIAVPGEWFSAIPGVTGTAVVGVSLLICGWVTVFFMGLAAFRIDRNADGECNELAEQSLPYRIAHIAFRMSEVAYRITTAVVFSDCMRIAATPIIGPHWGPPFLLVTPYVVFILAYSAILYWANPPVPHKKRDDAIAVLVVAITMLGINSVFFLDRSCCREAAARARGRLQRARACEFVLFVFAVLYTCGKHFPSDLCNSDFVKELFGPWLLQFRPGMVAQMVLSFILHHVLMFYHPIINLKLAQPTTATGGIRLAEGGPGSLSHSFTTEASMATVAQMTRTERAGMCQTLVRLGGLGVVARLTGAIELYDVTSFKHLSILGEGQYGVVVLTKREDSPERPTPSSISGQRLFAMKLVNLSNRDREVRPFRLRTPRELYESEKDTYRRVWQETSVPDAEDLNMASRAGHPFIVKLHYFFSCTEDQEFNIFEAQSTGTTVKTPIAHKRSPCFHEGLIMEHCEEGSLEKYAKDNFTEGGNVATFGEFEVVRKFLAEILLALDFLHRVKQVVYRDLKMSNVMVVNRRDLGVHVKLGDFGFSKKLDEGKQEVSLAGAPYWYAPEMLDQHEHGIPLDTTLQGHLALDIYSFGVVVFALAHGIPYWPDDTGRAHPMCQSGITGALARSGEASPNSSPPASPGHPCSCRACTTLRTLEWRFPTQFGNACIRDLIRVCIAREPTRRPTTQALRRSPLFTAEFDDERPGVSARLPRVDFGELLALAL